MRLKELREERNLTQNDVATAIRTTRTNIGRWEKGENEPSANFVMQLADFFEVSTDYLLGREDDFGNVSIQSNAPTLSAEEQRLLDTFRKLNAKNRIHVSAYADVRLEEQTEKN